LINGRQDEHQNFIPTNIALLRDWFERFQLNIDQVKIILKFLLLKNSYDEQRLLFRFIDSDANERNIIDLLDEEEFDEEELKKVIMINFDLEGLHLILFLINYLTMLGENNIISGIEENISTDYDTSGYGYKNKLAYKSLLEIMIKSMNDHNFSGTILSYACRGFEDKTLIPNPTIGSIAQNRGKVLKSFKKFI
jgi:hypothetical protein